VADWVFVVSLAPVQVSCLCRNHCHLVFRLHYSDGCNSWSTVDYWMEPPIRCKLCRDPHFSLHPLLFMPLGVL